MSVLAPALPWRVEGFSAALYRAEPPRPALAGVPTAAQARAIREREPGAWHELFDREMPAIYRYALSRLGDAGRAEDATSEVFEQAWRHAETFEDRGLPVRAWLFGIARNVVGSHRRSWFRRAPQLAIEAFDGAGDDAALSPERLDLARAVAALEPAHAEVISLRFVHGLSLQEAAEVIGASVDAVKGRQARALAALRERLVER
ncbi:MAG: sigma-70 family RNA polymerase sigma factor [Dehalococcoidia bacterium]|nr:sigma-70 family RNA polymerase sigma factor [Dehalococcoidia bacterium]